MKKVIASGELNQKVQFLHFADTDDGAGGSIPGEVVYWATAAKVVLLKSQRSLQANQEALKPSISLTIRNRIDKFLDTNMIVTWRGKRFNILSAEPDYVYKEWITVMAKAEDLPQR